MPVSRHTRPPREVTAAEVEWLLGTDAWRDWFPDQTCPGCGQEHPGQPCPEQEPLPIGDAMGAPGTEAAARDGEGGSTQCI